MTQVKIDRVVTSGTFNLDGGSWDVDNNVWLIGDERQVLVIDAAHDADAIVKEVACLYASGLGAVFTGDTLFQGGPGATGRSYSDRDLIFDSIRRRLLALPGSTEVHTGHGASTRISDEAGNCAA